MTDSKRRLLALGLPCCLAFVADSTVTLCAQPKEYWQGHYDWTVEDSLFFHALYVIQPLAAVAGYCAWAAVIAGLLLLLPEVLAVILAIVIVFGHVLGAYITLAPILPGGWYQVANGMFLAAAAALGIGLYWFLLTSSGDGLAGRGKPLPSWLRWGLIASLLGAGCFMIWSPLRG
jgi:hypothetical protein